MAVADQSLIWGLRQVELPRPGQGGVVRPGQEAPYQSGLGGEVSSDVQDHPRLGLLVAG